jgi:hypothetical protein
MNVSDAITIGPLPPSGWTLRAEGQGPKTTLSVGPHHGLFRDVMGAVYRANEPERGLWQQAAALVASPELRDPALRANLPGRRANSYHTAMPGAPADASTIFLPGVCLRVWSEETLVFLAVNDDVWFLADWRAAIRNDNSSLSPLQAVASLAWSLVSDRVGRAFQAAALNHEQDTARHQAWLDTGAAKLVGAGDGNQQPHPKPSSPHLLPQTVEHFAFGRILHPIGVHESPCGLEQKPLFHGRLAFQRCERCVEHFASRVLTPNVCGQGRAVSLGGDDTRPLRPPHDVIEDHRNLGPVHDSIGPGQRRQHPQSVASQLSLSRPRSRRRSLEPGLFGRLPRSLRCPVRPRYSTVADAHLQDAGKIPLRIVKFSVQIDNRPHPVETKKARGLPFVAVGSEIRHARFALTQSLQRNPASAGNTSSIGVFDHKCSARHLVGFRGEALTPAIQIWRIAAADHIRSVGVIQALGHKYPREWGRMPLGPSEQARQTVKPRHLPTSLEMFESPSCRRGLGELPRSQEFNKLALSERHKFSDRSQGIRTTPKPKCDTSINDAAIRQLIWRRGLYLDQSRDNLQRILPNHEPGIGRIKEHRPNIKSIAGRVFLYPRQFKSDFAHR